jgi:P pilus assembly chaperone PapD
LIPLEESVMKNAFLIILVLLGTVTASNAGVSVIGSLTRENTVGPGERYEGDIMVRNSDEKPVEVRIYKKDYLFYADGRNLYDESGSTPRSNATWITVQPAQMTVPPKGSGMFHYTVQAPKNVQLKGSYWSLLMVEPMAPPAVLPSQEKNKISIGLQTVIRYAIQIVTDIGASGEWQLKFRDKRVVMSEGKRLFEIDIENTGERWLSPVVWIDLYNAEGASIGRFESSQKRIYPGCSVRHQMDLTGVPAGTYSALAIADNKDDHVFGGQYEIVIK